MKPPMTTIGVSRETSQILDNVARLSGLSKYQLADAALRYFFDPEVNPMLDDALGELRQSKKQFEDNLLLSFLSIPRAKESQT